MIKFNLSKVEYSNRDKIRDVKLPKILTTELAELMGILTGDGHIGIYKGRTKYGNYVHYEIKFAGHWLDDREYYENAVNILFQKLFNTKLKVRNHNGKGNMLDAVIHSKAISSFIRNILKLPWGNKVSRIEIPKYIRNSTSDIKSAFLRGLADTDFSLTFKKKHKKHHYYPVISVSFKSRKIIEQITNILDEFNISCHVQYDDIYHDKRGFISIGHKIYIYGKMNLEKWMGLIGFNNPKHLTKYFVYKKLGFCPPYKTTKDRMEMLNKKRAWRDSNPRPLA